MTTSPTNPRGCYVVAGYLFMAFLVLGVIGAIAAYRYTSSTYSEAIQNAPTATPTRSVAEIRQRALRISYDNLARDTEKYVGQLLHIEGEIVQVLEGSGRKMDLRVRMVDGDAVLVHYEGPRVLDGDKVDIYATVDGRATYETVLGAQVTVPELTALALTVTKN